MSGSTNATVPKNVRSWSDKFLDRLGRKSKRRDSKDPFGNQPGMQVNPLYQPETQVNPLYEEDTGPTVKEALRGRGEQVHRKVKLGKLTLGTTKDKGYQRRIAEPVDALIAEIDALDGADVTPELISKARTLRSQLFAEQKKYDRTSGKTRDKSLQRQRMAKSEAIRDRIEALDALLEDDPDSVSDRLLDTDLDSEDAKAMVDEIVATYANDPDRMQQICDKLLSKQIALEMQSDPSTNPLGRLLRSNNPATQAAKAYVYADPECQKFLSDFQSNTTRLVGDAGKRLARAEKVGRGKTPLTEEQRQQIEDGLIIELVDSTLKSLLAQPIPDILAKTSEQLAVRTGEAGLDRDAQAMIIGGHVFLRVINPVLTTLLSKMDGGSTDRRLFVRLSKALQSISNGAKPNEDSMIPIWDATQQFVESVKEWLLQIANQ